MMAAAAMMMYFFMFFVFVVFGFPRISGENGSVRVLKRPTD
jgi:hypothetical protein